MKTGNLILALVAAALTACIPSVKPFYSPKDIAYDPALVGKWTDPSDGEAWEFAASGTNTYQLTITEKEAKTGKFEAVLFKFKNQTYLDLTPTDAQMAPDQADMVGACLIPGHLVVKAALRPSELELAMFDFDKLAKLLKEQPTAVAHHREGDRFVLTADTPALQEFLATHGAELFSAGSVLKLQNKSAPNPAPTSAR